MNTGSLAPARENQVEQEIGFATDKADLLYDRICNIEDRLSKVLRSEPQNEAVEKTAEKEVVPLADNIRLIRNKINRSIDKLDSILSRLEL